MPPILIQDIVVTALALGALVVLVRRTFGIFRVEKDGAGCDACGSCPAPAGPGEKQGGAVPVQVLRRAPTGAHHR